VSQQSAYLADLAKTIEAKQVEVKKQAEALPIEIRALQGQIQESRTEETRLTRQRDLAQTVYTNLAQKVEETRIAAQQTSGRARWASRAAAPEEPINKRFLVNTTMGVALGLLVGVMGAFAVEYFREVPAMSGESQVSSNV